MFDFMSDNGSLWAFMDRTRLTLMQYTIRECLILKENLTFEGIVSYLWGTVKSSMEGAWHVVEMWSSQTNPVY